ncbi:MAG: hypothetical protein L0Y36_06250, partial [Planctomycetales bacterium]|nr:hypothetical protein [Planctomycetales bacterium]
AGWIESSDNLKKYAYPNTLQTANSASVPVFFDSVWVDAWPKDTDTVPPSLNLEQEPKDTGTDSPVNNHIRRMLVKRHGGTINLSFLDGHVDSIKLEHLWNYKWHQDFVLLGGEKRRTDSSKIYK